MDSPITKRSRCSSFSPEEKILIANICAKYKSVLENKKTDQISSHQKNTAWDRITAEINASNISGIFRSKEVLKRFYENRKREVRKIAAEEKRELLKTGGGTAIVVKKDDIILSAMNKKTINGLDCEFGGDVDPHEQNTIVYEEDNTLNPELIVSNETWQKYVPMDLVAPISNSLRVPDIEQAGPSIETEGQEAEIQRNEGVRSNTARRRPTTVVKAFTRTEFAEKYNTLLDKRLGLVKKQEEKIEEEILSIKQAREAKMKLDALEYEIKLEHLRILKKSHGSSGST